MSLATTLWHDHAELADACLTHPFVQGIGDGSLARHRFAGYIGQDAFYLQAFARAYVIAAAKAPDWAGFRQLHDLAGGVLGELELHEGVAQEWGLDLATVTPKPATRRYTDFLLATAWSCETGITLAAMTPCMRLYAFLGAQLAKQPQRGAQYHAWIDTYSSADFAALAEHLEQLLDRCAPDRQRAMEVYRYAMQCELEFFASAWDAPA